MKFKLLIVIVFFSVISCTNSKQKLLGDWEIIEFAIFTGETQNMLSTRKILNDAGAVWDMKFTEDGNFVQEFNMRGMEKRMEKEAGSFEINKDTLTIIFQNEDRISSIPYKFEFVNDTLKMQTVAKGTDVIIKTKYLKK